MCPFWKVLFYTAWHKKACILDKINGIMEGSNIESLINGSVLYCLKDTNERKRLDQMNVIM